MSTKASSHFGIIIRMKFKPSVISACFSSPLSFWLNNWGIGDESASLIYKYFTRFANGYVFVRISKRLHSSWHVKLKHTPDMTCQAIKITVSPFFSSCWDSASRARKYICSPEKKKKKRWPVRAENKSIWHRHPASPPLSAHTSPSSLSGAISVLASLWEMRLCSGWQSQMSEIENLVRRSEGERWWWWLSLTPFWVLDASAWGVGASKMDDRLKKSSRLPSAVTI